MENIKEKFSKRLLEEMRALGYSTRVLSSMTLIPDLRIEDFLNNKDLPNRIEIKQLARTLNVEEAVFRIAVDLSKPNDTTEILVEPIIEQPKTSNSSSLEIKYKHLVSELQDLIYQSNSNELTKAEAAQFVHFMKHLRETVRAKTAYRMIGVSQASLYRYGSGQNIPTRNRLKEMLTVLKNYKDSSDENLTMSTGSIISTKIKRTGSKLLTAGEAKYFQTRFNNAVNEFSKKELREALDLTHGQFYSYRLSKTFPKRAKARKIIDKLNELETKNQTKVLKSDKKDELYEDIDKVKLQFRSALGYAIDRAGSLNKVANYLGKSHITVGKWNKGHFTPSYKNMLEYTDRLNRFRRVEDHTGQLPEYRQAQHKPVRIIKESQPTKDSETLFNAPLVCKTGSPRLRTVERKRFAECINAAVNQHGSKLILHILKCNHSQISRYKDLSRTVARTEAVRVLAKIQPLARAKKLKLVRNTTFTAGHIAQPKIDVVRVNNSQQTLPADINRDLSDKVAQPIPASPKFNPNEECLDLIEALVGKNSSRKELTVIDYNGNRRSLLEWLNELNQLVKSSRIIYTLEYLSEQNLLKSERVIINGLNNVYDFIENQLIKTADTIDVKLTFKSSFNETLMIHNLRYIKMSAVKPL